jgi:glycerophosphoryl diester phosphodiesterase
VFVFSTSARAFTGQVLEYRTESPGTFVSDMWALDSHRLAVIERDGGRGPTATFRKVYLVDVRNSDSSGFLDKTAVLDLTRIPDPDLVSLPAIHRGDLGLGDPFWVMCESVEAIHLIAGQRLMIGCDNNFPNSGRNPALADDNEFIVVDVPGLKSLP